MLKFIRYNIESQKIEDYENRKIHFQISVGSSLLGEKKLIVDCPFWLNIHKVVHIHIQEKTECCVHYGNPVNVYRSGNVNEEMG